LVGIVKVKPGQNVEPDRLVSYVNGETLNKYLCPTEIVCRYHCSVKYFSDRVKDHERLRGGIIFVDDVPRSPAGKLKREELQHFIQ